MFITSFIIFHRPTHKQDTAKQGCLRETNIREMVWGDGGETTCGGWGGGGGVVAWFCGAKRRRVKTEVKQLGWKRFGGETSCYLIKYTGGQRHQVCIGDL